MPTPLDDLTKLDSLHVGAIFTAVLGIGAGLRKWLRRENAEAKIDDGYKTLIDQLLEDMKVSREERADLRKHIEDCHKMHDECRDANIKLQGRVAALEAKAKP